MTGKSLEKNVKVKLGLLEAKTGKDASISWCKAVVNSRKPSNKVKTLLDSAVDPEAAITELRREKVESKLFHVRKKILPKQMKKVKVFMTQRVVKKIKQKKTENAVEEEIRNLEGELSKVKSLDHIKLATWAFNMQIFKNDEYLQEKLRELGIVIPEAERIQEAEKVMNVKCFQDAIKACRSDLNNFVRKLLHESPVEVKKKQVSNEVKKTVKVSKPLSADKSFFMTSLNENDSEDEKSDVGSVGDESEEIYGRVAFTDDEEEENGFFSEEEEEQKPKKKKNRLGQVARRRLAEKMYGREAKHIQSGGLTVQQREEQRKLKSQQRKERSERIKRDAKRPVARGSKEIVDSFKGSKSNSNANENVTTNTNVKVNAIKIDPKMHPSWAAKLQQQAKLQQTSFQGQKIKFDEE